MYIIFLQSLLYVQDLATIHRFIRTKIAAFVHGHGALFCQHDDSLDNNRIILISQTDQCNAMEEHSML